MSLKSKLLNFTAQAKESYKSACEQSKDAWQNSDCSIPESVKESTKIKFALWSRDKSELASGYQTSGYAGEGFYSYGVYEDDD